MFGGPRRLSLLVTCAVVMVGCSSGSADRDAVAEAITPADTLGLYNGPVDTAGLRAFQRRLGRKVGYAHDYLDRRSWSKIRNVSWLAPPWRSAGFARRFVLTVPMLPDTGGTLARGARGRYDKHFRALARNLVRERLGRAVLRLGHEFNGNWYRWSIKARRGGRDFGAYWRRIVTTMRSVPGARFKFDWSPVAGGSYVGRRRLDAASAWPGDAYVDFVGLDVFDQSYIPQFRDAVARWHDFVHQKDGLLWHAAFAAAHGKPMTFPEWGLADRIDGHGGGDNPYFIQRMHEWIQAHNVAYHLYFESHDSDADHAIFSGWFPNAANTFIDLFGSRAGVGRRIGGHDAAALRISRAQILPSSSLSAVARLSSSASGEARIQLAAAGRKVRFSAPISRGTGRLKIRHPLERRMARPGVGMLTVAYGGDDDTHPQIVSLRAGRHRPGLNVQQKTVADGRVGVSGVIGPDARGEVLVELRYVVDAQTVTRSFSTPIRNGRWSVSAPLGDVIAAEIERRQGPVTASVVYGGHGARRIRGEVRSYEVLPPR